jgi:DNA-binding NarL/FixJ family response regulator
VRAWQADPVASAWLAFRRCLIAVIRCLRDAGFAILAAPMFAFAPVVGLLTGPVLGPLLATATRWHPTLTRHLTRIESPYPPRPAGNYRAQVRWFWTHPATWRDFTWLLAEPIVGIALLLPGLLALYGWVGLVLPGAEQWIAFFYGTNAPSFRITAVLVGLGLPILVLSQHIQRLYARELLADGAGGVGYLLKDRVAGGTELTDALHRIAAGGTVMDAKVIATMMADKQPIQTLTACENDVLALMAQGKSSAAIAGSLHLSEGAVSKYTTTIFAKLEIRADDDTNRRVLAVLAYLDRRD